MACCSSVSSPNSNTIMSSSLGPLYLRKYDPEKGDHPVRMVVEHMQVGMLRSMSEWLEVDIMPEIMNPDRVGSGIVSCLKDSKGFSVLRCLLVC